MIMKNLKWIIIGVLIAVAIGVGIFFIVKAVNDEPEPTITAVNEKAEQSVYWVPTGKVYHLKRDCSTLSRSTVIRSGTIAESKKSRVCKVCG